MRKLLMENQTILNLCTVSKICLFGFIIFSLGFPAYAAMYKWIDEDGNVHYTQTKPDIDVETEIINPQSKADNTELEREISDRKAREKGYEEYQREKEKEQEQLAKQEALRETNCKKSKELLEKVKSMRRFRVKDEEGNPTWADNDQHQATIDRLQGNVKKFCK